MSCRIYLGKYCDTNSEKAFWVEYTRKMYKVYTKWSTINTQQRDNVTEKSKYNVYNNTNIQNIFYFFIFPQSSIFNISERSLCFGQIKIFSQKCLFFFSLCNFCEHKYIKVYRTLECRKFV